MVAFTMNKPCVVENRMNMKVNVRTVGSFGGVALAVLVINERPYFIAAEISDALGYDRSGRIADFVRGKWAHEFTEQDDILIPDKKLISTLKPALAAFAWRQRGVPLLLSEAAVRRVISLSGMPRAVAFGTWLESTCTQVQAPTLAARCSDLERRCERLEAALARLTSQTGQGSGYALADAQGAFCALWSRDLGSVAKTYQEVFRWAEASMERQGLARLVCGSEFKSVAIRNWLKSAVWCSFTAPDGQRYSIQESNGPRYWVRRD